MSNESRPTKDTAEQGLCDQLRREALAERPMFSSELHARVLAAVASPGDSTAIEPLVSNRSARRKLIQWAAVAAGLAAALFGAFQFLHTDDAPLLPGRQAPRLAHAGPPPTMTLDELNHGAGIALRLVVDQLPIEVPADDWGLPAIE